MSAPRTCASNALDTAGWAPGLDIQILVFAENLWYLWGFAFGSRENWLVFEDGFKFMILG